MKTFTGKEFEQVRHEHENILKFKETYGQKALIEAIYHGAFSEVAYDYIHSTDEIKSLPDYQPIMGAFAYAYT